MILVIDTNILIAALIKDGTTRQIIAALECDIVYPEEALRELKNYEKLIQEKSGLNVEEYNTLLDLLFKKITIIPQEKIKIHINEASQIIGKRGPDDIIFLATALSYKNAIIWSEDKDFEKQEEVKVFKTKDIIKMLEEV